MRKKQTVAVLLMPVLLIMMAIPGSFTGKILSQDHTAMAKFIDYRQVENQENQIDLDKSDNEIKPTYAAASKMALLEKEVPEIKEKTPTLTPYEKELLARLVQAEAKGEPFEGKVAVAEVVLNRVESNQFPDTIKDVIYQKRQFQPVANGEINEPASTEAKKAVEEAISPDNDEIDALYFFNPDLTESKWMHARPIVEEIGQHRFTS